MSSKGYNKIKHIKKNLKSFMNNIHKSNKKNNNGTLYYVSKNKLIFNFIEILTAFSSIGDLIRTINKYQQKSKVYSLNNFWNELANGKLSEEDIKSYYETLKNETTLEDELNYFSTVVLNYNNAYKSKILGKLYVNALKGKITRDKLYRLASVIDNLIVEDIQVLEQIKKEQPKTEDKILSESAPYRLSALGLINTPSNVLLEITDGKQPPLFRLLEDGMILCEFGLEI